MNIERFLVTLDHLKLIKRMYVRYNDHCEFGAPEIDPKRPYGNGDVYGDIGKILGFTQTKDDDMVYTEEQEGHMLGIHKETAIALQILTQRLEIREGTYEREKYGGKWTMVDCGGDE